MTHLVSFGDPSGPHAIPPALIKAGIEASIITSEGTCKFVIPRSLSTIYRSASFSRIALKSCVIFESCDTRSNISPSPELGLTPNSSRTLLCLLKTSLKKTETT